MNATFPMKLWCQIVPQTERQPSLLRTSTATPTISSFAHLYGQHSYDTHPFGILDSKVELHVMPQQRQTWDPKNKTGYYLGPTWEHYHCHLVWVSKTKATRVGQKCFQTQIHNRRSIVHSERRPPACQRRALRGANQKSEVSTKFARDKARC